MWGFTNKSKYKKKDHQWWDDEVYLEAERAETYGGWGYNSGYSYNWYKPRYDMSISLETRVRQLIRTVTGKDLKLIKAEGWGSDENHFYYNPEDLENASDDEVLGRILHQLGKELYVDKDVVAGLVKKEPDYRHLLTTLEDNRADALIQVRYPGVGYYAQEVWEQRKFIDNPLNQYVEGEESTDPEDFESVMRLWEKRGYSRGSLTEQGWRDNKDYWDDWVSREEKENGDVGIPQNDSWEFCFNISALQNGETDWDFTKEEVKANFEKAVPYIRQYLAAPTFPDALRIYPEIKKYYPLPTKEQQKQMDKQMGQSEGLSQAAMKNLAAAAARAAAEGMRGSGKVRGEDGEGDDDESESFYKDFAHDYRRGEFMTKATSLTKYKEYLKEHKPTANVLFTLIRSILKDNTTKRFDRPFKRGKLDAKRVYKLIATDNLRIFKKKRNINEKDYLMMVVVDMSGSMRGHNSKYATQGAIVLTDVIERLGFPYEVIAYNGSVYGVKMFNKALRPEILAALENANGDNNERETIEVISKHIAAYDGSNKYKKTIFWITDGQSNDPSTVKKKVGELEKKHNATVYAIGIGNVDEKFLKESYNTYMLVDKIEDLPKELINLMRQQFRRN